jgi:hypothetical protein
MLLSALEYVQHGHDPKDTRQDDERGRRDSPDILAATRGQSMTGKRTTPVMAQARKLFFISRALAPDEG